jgi:hypothetical protein
VLEYVKLNAEASDIGKKIKDWERKLEIVNMAYKKEKFLTTRTQRFGQTAETGDFMSNSLVYAATK